MNYLDKDYSKSFKILKKSKRLFFSLLFIIYCLLPTNASAYQQQGFSSYAEQENNISFSCQNQCSILLGEMQQKDLINIQWNIQWNGMLAYGFLVGQQIAPWWQITINWWSDIDQTFLFQDFPQITQIPDNTQIVLLIQWNIQWTINPKLNKLWNKEKFTKWRKDFWTNETLTPYSINLRYWVKILGTSIIKIMMILFFIWLIFILINKKRKSKKIEYIFYRALILFSIIATRNLLTQISITSQWISSYTKQSYENKTFFDLWDYITFTDKIRKQLKLDEQHDLNSKNCKIFVNTNYPRPFKDHRSRVYLKPCSITDNQEEANYIIYYKSNQAPDSFIPNK